MKKLWIYKFIVVAVHWINFASDIGYQITVAFTNSSLKFWGIVFLFAPFLVLFYLLYIGASPAKVWGVVLGFGAFMETEDKGV